MVKRKRKKTERQKLVEECDDLLKQIMRLLYGDRCLICKTDRPDCGVFHILGKGAYRNLRWHYKNVLWVGWFCCHYNWHHDPYYARDIIFVRLRELLGENYEDELKELSRSLPDKITIEDLREIKQRFQRRINLLKEKYGIKTIKSGSDDALPSFKLENRVHI